MILRYICQQICKIHTVTRKLNTQIPHTKYHEFIKQRAPKVILIMERRKKSWLRNRNNFWCPFQMSEGENISLAFIGD